jgi:intein/homing endonuclease
VPCDGLEYGQQRQSQSAIIVTPPVEENYCFLAGTPILMADGSTKAIEQVKVGDKIIAFDEKTGELKKDKVTEFFEHDAQEYLIVNGHLKVTANHLVYHNGKWVEIGKLKIGDSLLDSQGKPQQITDIKKMRASVKVYNLEVNPYHTYFAGGFLVHNKVRIRPR